MANVDNSAGYTLRDLVVYFLRLGTFGFGGPVALVGYMHRDLVVEKKWILDEDYKEGLALSQLAPGPLAAQLSIYLGYVHYGVLGASLTGLAFVLPSFIMVLLLGWAYVAFEGLSWMQAVFYGVSAAVIGIIAVSTYKMTTKSLGKDYVLWAISLVLTLFTFYTESENVFFILGGGLIYWLFKSPPKSKMLQSFVAVPALLLTVTPLMFDSKLGTIAWFFAKAGAFVFGSGLAIVPFLYGGVVKEYHWLNEQQFLDAVAVAMITPGPVVITVGFIGYLIAGVSGAAVAALATFVPCYFFTILPAPYFKKHGKNPAIKLIVDGITAGAIGAIAGAVLVLAKRNLVDITTLLIALLSVFVLIKFKKITEPYLIVAASILGLLLYQFK